MDQEPQSLDTPDQAERRRHTRYRLKEKLLIRRKNGSVYPATTSEISIGGLSATNAEGLRVGEEVHLSPVVGEQVSAVVRHKAGPIFGFEFTNAQPKVVEEIHILCKGLVALRSVD